MSEKKNPNEKKLDEQWLEVADSAEYCGLSHGSALQLAKEVKRNGGGRRVPVK